MDKNNININYIEYSDSEEYQNTSNNSNTNSYDNDLYLSFDNNSSTILNKHQYNNDSINDNIDNMDNMDNMDNIDNMDNMDNIDNMDNMDNIDNMDNMDNIDKKPLLGKFYRNPKDNIVESESDINPYLAHLFENKNLKHIDNDIKDTKTHLRKNIDKLIDRDTKIQNLEDKSKSLLEHSENFKKRSKNLKITMFQKYLFHILSIMILILIIVVLILILVRN